MTLKLNKMYTSSNITILYFINLIYYNIVVSDELCILFHFNIISKHNGMYSTKMKMAYSCRDIL